MCQNFDNSSETELVCLKRAAKNDVIVQHDNNNLTSILVQLFLCNMRATKRKNITITSCNHITTKMSTIIYKRNKLETET